LRSEQTTTSLAPLYDRIVIKISGESLGEYSQLGNSQRFAATAQMIAAVHSMGVATTVVAGGGNIFRAALADKYGLTRKQADEVGMAATGLNVLILQGLLSNLGLVPAVFSRGPAGGIGHPYDREHVQASLQNGAIVLLAGGLGKSGISTDVAAIEAAIDTGTPAVIMSKHGVDGVYTSDPRDPQDGTEASFIPDLTASEALEQRLQVTDAASLHRARDHGKLIHVVSAAETYAPRYLLEGKEIGSRIIPV
jgi:uridylate kinase